MSGPLQVEERAYGRLWKWFEANPEATDPDTAIVALELPDMTGIPVDPADRDATQQRMAYDADTMSMLARLALERVTNQRETTAWRELHTRRQAFEAANPDARIICHDGVWIGTLRTPTALAFMWQQRDLGALLDRMEEAASKRAREGGTP